MEFKDKNKPEGGLLGDKYDTPEMLNSIMDRPKELPAFFSLARLETFSNARFTVTILDISYWQKPTKIDYDQISAAVDGVILRAAYGTAKDTTFDDHYKEFTKKGTPVGAYHYLIGNYSAQAQLETLKNAITGKELPLGIWGDIEDRRPGTRLQKAVALEFMNLLQGKKGIYTSQSAWDEIIGDGSLGHLPLWIANYGTSIPRLPKTGSWKTFNIWQHTDKGRLPGYEGDLDLNRWNGTKESYEFWVCPHEITPPPDPDPIEQPEIPGETGALYKAECTAGALNIREGAGATFPATGEFLYKGEIESVWEEKAGWLKITRGWVSGAYMQRVIETGNLSRWIKSIDEWARTQGYTGIRPE